MNPARLLKHFDRISEAPEAVAKLRAFVLKQAVQGRLVPQDSGDAPAGDQLLVARRSLAAKAVDTARLRWKASEEISSDLAPFAVPTGWILARLNDTGLYINGLPFKPSDWGDAGLPIIRIQNLSDPGKPFNRVKGTFPDEVIVRDGDILVSWSATLDAFVWNRGPGVLNQHIFRVLPASDLVDTQFLTLLLRQAIRDLAASEHAHGLVMAHINRGPFLAHVVAIPPRAEQHRIVAKVDELMALCDQLQAAQLERERRRDRLVGSSLNRLNQARDLTVVRRTMSFHLTHLGKVTTRPDQMTALRETILNLAVLGRLSNQNPEEEKASALLSRIRAKAARTGRSSQFQSTTALDTRPEHELPEGWTSVHLSDLSSLVTSGSRGWAEFYSKVGPKFIRAQNIRFGRLRLDDLACVTPPAGSEGARTQVSPGDLLVVITGAGVTNPALLDRDLGEAYVSQHVGLVRPAMIELSRWLLLCLMAHAGGRSQLLQRAYGAGKPGLNLDNIRTLIIPLPPMAEQLRILAKVGELVSICDRLESALEVRRACDVRLLDAVLHEALTVDLPQADRVAASPPFAKVVELKQGRRSASSERQTETVLVPHLGTIAAGVLTFAEQRIEGWFHIPKDLMKAGDGDWCVLRVGGNSMNLAEVDHKRIEDGDFLLVRRQDEPEPGKIVVAEFEGEVVLKRFVNTAAGAVLRAESTGPYPDIAIEPGFRVQGVVLANLKSGSEFERTDEQNG